MRHFSSSAQEGKKVGFSHAFHVILRFVGGLCWRESVLEFKAEGKFSIFGGLNRPIVISRVDEQRYAGEVGHWVWG